MEAIRRGLAVWATGRWYRTSWLHTFISTITREDARRKARSSPRLYPQLERSLTQATSEPGWSVEATFCFCKVSRNLFRRSHLVNQSPSPVGVQGAPRPYVCSLGSEAEEDWLPWPSPRLCSEHSRLRPLGFMPSEHNTCAPALWSQNGSFWRLQTNNWKARVWKLKFEIIRPNKQMVTTKLQEIHRNQQVCFQYFLTVNL